MNNSENYVRHNNDFEVLGLLLFEIRIWEANSFR